MYCRIYLGKESNSSDLKEFKFIGDQMGRSLTVGSFNLLLQCNHSIVAIEELNAAVAYHCLLTLLGKLSIGHQENEYFTTAANYLHKLRIDINRTLVIYLRTM